MSNKIPCSRSIEQICDILEIHLGHEAGNKLCQEVAEHIRNCPKCCAEIDTLARTVKIFREMPKSEVPDDVQFRLMKELKLEIPSDCDEEQG